MEVPDLGTAGRQGPGWRSWFPGWDRASDACACGDQVPGRAAMSMGGAQVRGELIKKSHPWGQRWEPAGGRKVRRGGRVWREGKRDRG